MGAALVAMFFAGCNKPATKPAAKPAAAGGPQVSATVVTIRTQVQPSGRAFNHRILIGESVARSMDEADSWRLYDLAANRVTFVDDIEKTVRTVSFDSLVAARRGQLRRSTDTRIPAASYEATDTQKQILHFPATRSVITLGSYTRELWFARHPNIPDQLFSMMHASNPPSKGLAAEVAGPDEALLAVRAFPFEEHAEMPYGKQKMVVDRTVLSVEKQNVAEALLQLPKNYKDITVATAPAVNRPPAASRPPGQSAPAAGSPPSATSQRTP